MKPEDQEHLNIYDLLTHSGWAVQDYMRLNLDTAVCAVVRAFSLLTGTADNMLFANGDVAGTIEAKHLT